MNKLFKKSTQRNADTSLNITAMADIFTIILVFLLKSFSTGATVTPTKGLTLPSGQANAMDFTALKVEVTADSVLVEGEPAAQLSKYTFDPKDVQKDKSSQSLSEAISTYRKRQLAIAQQNPDVEVDSKILVVADKEVPYVTIKSVLASAAIHGYTDFKLAVVIPQ